MTDGTVLVHDYGNYQHWWRLTPTSALSYVHATWSAAGSMNNGRLYGQTAVFKDGRVLYGGGEYLSGSYTDHNGIEIYNLLTNAWTVGPDSLYDSLGDTGNAILSDGRLLASNWGSGQTDIYNPVTNSWSAAGSLLQDTGDEETWISLPDGSVLATYNVGQRYIPSLNNWITTDALPVGLVSAAGEIGPAVMLYTGKVLVLGGTGHTAIYTPPTSMMGTGTWVQGPDVPAGCSFAGDTPCAVEINGKVLCCGAASEYGNVTNFFEYDPASNTFSVVPSPTTGMGAAFALRMLSLPNGRVLLTGTGSTAYLYTSSSGASTSTQPTVTSVTKGGTGYLLSGKNLNGFSNGASYGDEANPYTNYPIVVLYSSANGFQRCRSYNFSTMAYSTGSSTVTCNFSLPAGVTSGTYTLYVITNGIMSNGISFTP